MGHFRNNEPTLEDIHEKAKGIYDCMTDEEIIDKFFPIFYDEIFNKMEDIFIDYIESKL